MRLFFSVLAISALFFCSALFAEQSLPEPISDLLSGHSTNIQETVSALNEKDLPLSLGFVPILKFKTLHGELKIPEIEIENFRKDIEKRLAEAKTVSLQKSEVCSISISSQEITFGEYRFVIPAHFVAPESLTIVDCGPKGETGTILPDIWVSFLTDKFPVTSKILLDGKPIEPSHPSSNQILFRPEFSENGLFGLGTHTVSATLIDGYKRQATVSWNFTIGVELVSDTHFPEDAKVVGTFSFDAASLFKNSSVTGKAEVVVYQSKDGCRFLEYVYRENTRSGLLTVRIRNLSSFRHFLEKKSRDGTVTIHPLTGKVFPGNSVRFSAQYDGPGTVLKTSWSIHEDSQTLTSDEPVFPYDFKRSFANVTCRVTVKGDSPSWPDSVTEFETYRDCYLLIPNLTVNPTRSGIFTQTGTGSINLYGSRGLISQPLVENSTFDLFGGKITVIQSRWEKAGGNVEPVIENPFATSTRLLFDKPGFVDIIHRVKLAYDYGNEHYEGEFTSGVQPNFYGGETGLFGVFNINAVATFSRIPPGIFYKTSRFIKIGSVDFEINGEKRQITASEGSIFEPPWVIARSTLNPASEPIQLKSVDFQIYNKTSPLSKNDQFIHTLKYDQINSPSSDYKFHCQAFCSLIPSVTFQNSFFTLPISSDIPIQSYQPNGMAIVDIIPSPPPIIRDDQKILFTPRIISKPEMGYGVITSAGGVVNVLDGYEFTYANGPTWNVIKGSTTTDEENQWGFEFQPRKGPGTYSVNCSFNVNFREMETGSLGSIPINGQANPYVIPGLRITSPIASFSYPLGANIEIRTSRDGNLEDWKAIQWSLNGEPWTTEAQVPPHKIALTKPGMWSLTATLKTTDSTGQETVLSNTSTFEVFPASITIKPERKIIPPGSGTVPIEITVTVNGQPLPDIYAEPDVGYGLQGVRIERVKWFGTGDATLKVDSSQLKANLDFTGKTGAETTLATVTLRVKTRATNPYQNTINFDFPLRADVWAVKNPEWESPPEFPKKGIVDTRRTFTMINGNFLWNGTSFSWSEAAGIVPPLVFNPAVPRAEPLTAATISFGWNGPNNQIGKGLTFQPTLPNSGANIIRMTASLDFGNSGAISFSEINHTIIAEPLTDLVTAFVDPASFALFVGGIQKLTFGVKVKESQQKSKSKEELFIQDGNYSLHTDTVTWIKDGETLGSGNPFDFTIKGREDLRITSKAIAVLNEMNTTTPAPSTQHELSADTTGYFSRLIAYPGEGYVFPASFPFLLKAQPSLSNSSQVLWEIDGHSVGQGPSVLISNLDLGDHLIKATLQGVSEAKETRNIHVFPLTASFETKNPVVVWVDNSTTTNTSLAIKIDSQTVTSGSVIGVKKALVSITGVENVVKADPIGCATISNFQGNIATITFQAPGSFGALASLSIEVRQSDTNLEKYSMVSNSILNGAIKAQADYSLSSDPKQAIVGTQRLFVVGSVTLKINDLPPVVLDKSIPQAIDPPIVVAKQLFTDFPEISCVNFTQMIEVTTPRKKAISSGINIHPVLFPDLFPRRITWEPILKLSNEQSLSLKKSQRTLNPQELKKLIKMRVVAEKQAISHLHKTDVHFFFGKDDNHLDQQEFVELFDKDYKVTLKTVDWFFNGVPLFPQGPTITFSGDSIGNFVLSASPTFFIEPQEGKEFGNQETLEIIGPTIKVATARIKEISFSGPNCHELMNDNATLTYSPPQWKDNGGADDPGDRKFPVAFTSSTSIFISGKFVIDGPATLDHVKIRGSETSGFGIPETTISVENNEINLPSTAVIGPYKKEVQAFDPFEITWDISFDDGATWDYLGETRNQLYFTLDDPLIPEPIPHTLVHVSCKNANSFSDPNEIVEKIWGGFKNRRVFRVNTTQPLTYWNTTADHSGANTNELLKTGDGECGAWADFFIDCLKMQGIKNASKVEVIASSTIPNRVLLLVKKWKFVPPGTSSSTFPFEYIENKELFKEYGIPGQGIDNPYYSAFLNHYIVQFEREYFDPSYGTGPFPSQLEWENSSLDGFAIRTSEALLGKKKDLSATETVFK
ncbi:MAG: hypothetical protein HQM08_23120 [Candidatus Riflebacteria bacterium]|nr:hypothetical protein [Candidatus Riflebacteria bacterium]